MKVSHIITGLATGGAERNLSNIIQWTEDKYDHEVIVLTKKGPIAKELMDRGISIVELGFPRGRITAKGMLRLFRKLSRGKTDVVQTWMYHSDLIGGVMARMAGYSNIFWNIRLANLQDASLPKSTILTARLSAMMSRIIPKNIVVNSESGKETHENLGYLGSKFVVIPNGFDTVKYSRDAEAGLQVRRELEIPEDNTVFIKVARCEPQKQHDVLLDAFSHVLRKKKDATLLLVGRGCSNSNLHLKKLLQERGLEHDVRLIGEKKNVVPYYSAATCYTSSSSAEGLPNSIAEAMSCQLPSVATSAGDSARLIGTTGLASPVGDAVRLADGMMKIANLSQEEKLQRGIQARSRIIQNYSKEMAIQKYDSLWKRSA